MSVALRRDRDQLVRMDFSSGTGRNAAREEVGVNSCNSRVNYSSVGCRTRMKYPLETKAEAVPRCKSEDFDAEASRLTSHGLSFRTRSCRCRSRSIIRRRRLSAPERRDLARGFAAGDRDTLRASPARGSSSRASFTRNVERRSCIDEERRFMDEERPCGSSRWEIQRSAFRQPVLHDGDRYEEIVASAFHACPLATPSALVHMPMVYLRMPREVDRGRRVLPPCLMDDSHFQ